MASILKIADHQKERGEPMQKNMSDQMGHSKQERAVREWMARHDIKYSAAKELLEILYGNPTKLTKETDNGQ